MPADRIPTDVAVRRALPTLKAALDAAQVPSSARVLQLGGGQGPLASALSGIDGPVFLADPDGADSPPRVSRIGGDPFVAEFPSDIDLCLAVPGLVRIPDMIEGLLFDGIYPALREGGIVALLFPRDATDRTLIAQGAAAIRVRATLQAFLEAHFGGPVIAEPEQIGAKFEHCPFFEFVDIATRGKGTFDADAMVWLILRKRAGRPPKARKKQTRAFARTPRTDQFSLDELKGLLSSLKEAGVALLPVHEFSERYAAYWALDSRARRQFNSPVGLVKFDIHGNIRRAYEIAEMLSDIGVPGLFLMMHRHPLNQEYYDSPLTWRMLKRMQASGHEIGIHADPFLLIRESGDLHRGLKEAIIDLRHHGLTIRSATLHGDTREHIKARGLQANDFFRERYRKTRWDGLPPEGEETLAAHVHQYSHRRIASQFGIEYFPEVNFLKDGQLLTRDSMLYMSDNARAIRITGIPRYVSPLDQLTAEKPFVIDPVFVDKAVGILTKRPFLALFHPQWYW